ncbi:hypothetical protein CRM76_00775 [Edwardsiella tarda]|uniref:Uncharacterized protein n=1 Tax=Edwardsiella tarda TaxID=636 RepID=A0A2A7U7M1_EDWTA|nr:hypothetical protein CRM76_00775 [Edwardsiella tarda]
MLMRYIAVCASEGDNRLPIAYCLLPIAYCLLPIAYCLLPIAYCLLPIAYCLLPIAYCPLLIAHCSLLIAHCSLLIALGMASAQALIRNGLAAACLLIGRSERLLCHGTTCGIRMRCDRIVHLGIVRLIQ